MTPASTARLRPPRRLAHAGRLLLRRLVIVVLCTYAASCFAGAVVELLHSLTGADAVAHADGSPCPDPSDGDHPCGPGCPCACCHAPVSAPDFSACRPSEALVACTALDEQLRDDLHPEDVPSRIFHPPRA